MNDVRIVRGLGPKQVEEASVLIYDAFRQKVDFELRPYSREQAVRIISVSFVHLDSSFVALAPDGSVVGLAGIGRRGAPFHRIQFGVLRREFGFAGGLQRKIRALLDDLLRVPKGALRVEVLAVSERARGEGIGTRLLEAVVAEARGEGAEAVVLEVVDTNPRARKLYENVGFEPVRRIPTAFLTRGEGFGAFDMMRLRL